VRFLFDLMTILAQVRVASRLSEIMVDALTKLDANMMCADADAFLDIEDGNNRRVFFEMGTIEEELFFAVDLHETMKTTAESFTLLTVENTSSLQDWLDIATEADCLPIALEPEQDVTSWSERLKSLDTAGKFLALYHYRTHTNLRLSRNVIC